MRIFKDLELVENLGSGIPPIVEKYGKKIFFFSKNICNCLAPNLHQQNICKFRHCPKYI